MAEKQEQTQVTPNTGEKKQELDILAVLSENVRIFKEQAKNAEREALEAEKKATEAKTAQAYALGKADGIKELVDALSAAKDNIELVLK